MPNENQSVLQQKLQSQVHLQDSRLLKHDNSYNGSEISYFTFYEFGSQLLLCKLFHQADLGLQNWTDQPDAHIKQ